MEIVTYNVPLQRGKPLTIVPIGDIQWAGKKGPTSLSLLKETIDKGLAADAWYIGMGDYIDFLSPSNRQRLAGANLYDTAMDVVDNTAMRLVEEIYEEALKPTRGRWLGMLEGHHFSQLKSGTTTDQKLCEMLDAKFLGSTAFVRLNFIKGGGGKGRSGGYPLVIWAAHGSGGSGKIAGPLSKLENILPYWDADIFLAGHHTKQVVGAINRIYPYFHASGDKLVHRKLMLVGTGGFAKGYMEGSKEGQVPRGGYVEQGLMNPAALGAPIVRIVPRMEGEVWAPEITAEI